MDGARGARENLTFPRNRLGAKLHQVDVLVAQGQTIKPASSQLGCLCAAGLFGTAAPPGCLAEDRRPLALQHAEQDQLAETGGHSAQSGGEGKTRLERSLTRLYPNSASRAHVEQQQKKPWLSAIPCRQLNAVAAGR